VPHGSAQPTRGPPSVRDIREHWRDLQLPLSAAPLIFDGRCDVTIALFVARW
jgi:hypothetical protein